MKIGLFGGTFNPVHNGHIRVAEELLLNFPLDSIIIIPSSYPPHKEKINLLSSRNRYAMAMLAFTESERISVSDAELKRKGVSFSVDTVDHFIKSYNKNNQLYFITGIDAFIEIDTWNSYTEILKSIPFIIAERPGPWQNRNTEARSFLSGFLRDCISESYTYQEAETLFSHKEFQNIYLFRSSMIDISSSEIRNRIRSNQDLTGYLPEKVEHYIKKGKLYT